MEEPVDEDVTTALSRRRSREQACAELLRRVVRAFYTTAHAVVCDVVIDARLRFFHIKPPGDIEADRKRLRTGLTPYSRIISRDGVPEDEIAKLVHLSEKEARKLLGALQKAGLLKCNLDEQKEEADEQADVKSKGAKGQGLAYEGEQLTTTEKLLSKRIKKALWHVDYDRFVKVLRYRFSEMNKMLNVDEQNIDNDHPKLKCQTAGCTQREYDWEFMTMQLAESMDGEVVCPDCQKPLVEVISAKASNSSVKPRMNAQLKKLRDRLGGLIALIKDVPARDADLIRQHEEQERRKEARRAPRQQRTSTNNHTRNTNSSDADVHVKAEPRVDVQLISDGPALTAPVRGGGLGSEPPWLKKSEDELAKERQRLAEEQRQVRLQKEHQQRLAREKREYERQIQEVLPRVAQALESEHASASRTLQHDPADDMIVADVDTSMDMEEPPAFSVQGVPVPYYRLTYDSFVAMTPEEYRTYTEYVSEVLADMDCDEM